MRPTPLVDAWQRARARDLRPLQIPGHKQRYRESGDAPGSALLAPLVRDDIPLQGGVDTNAYTGHYLELAEAQWARDIGAAHARFLVGGSSQGNIAAFTALGPGTVVVDRSSHRSALAGLIVSGAIPRWVFQELHPEFGIPVGMAAASVSAAADGAHAAFVTSPSYVGTVSAVAALAAAAHERGLVLAVDQAWGAHLDFLPEGGAGAAGADLVTTSIHKALTGYSQTATLAAFGTRIDPARLDRAVDLLATTSPSGTLLASIDATGAVMAGEGRAALERAVELVARMRAALRAIRGVVVIDEAEAGCAVDPLKVTLWLPRTGVTGTTLGAELESLGHGVENADRDTIVMTMSIADEPAVFDEAAVLIARIIEANRGEPLPPSPAALWSIEPEVAMTPREAYLAPRRRVRLNQAAGLVSADQACPYPPGVPLIAPGERIAPAIIEAIGIAATTGRVAYASDPTLATIEVIAD